MIPGKKFSIGEKTYEVPPLTLGQLRRGALATLKAHDELIDKKDTYGAMLLRGDVIVMALKRNYPDLNEEEITDNLDVVNTTDIFLFILGISGFKPGEAQAAGEITAPTNGA